MLSSWLSLSAGQPSYPHLPARYLATSASSFLSNISLDPFLLGSPSLSRHLRPIHNVGGGMGKPLFCRNVIRSCFYRRQGCPTWRNTTLARAGTVNITRPRGSHHLLPIAEQPFRLLPVPGADITASFAVAARAGDDARSDTRGATRAQQARHREAEGSGVGRRRADDVEAVLRVEDAPRSVGLVRPAAVPNASYRCDFPCV